MTLEDLTNEALAYEQLMLTNVRPWVKAESDRGVALMFGAMVERALQTVICTKLKHLTPTETKEWFDGINAPFRSFEAKIKLGRGVMIYDAGVERKLTLIRKIRNVFAHRQLPLDFSHPALEDSRLELLDGLEEFNSDPKQQFAGYCLGAVKSLLDWKRDQEKTE